VSTLSEEFQRSLLDWAVAYSLGELPVFPLHSPRREPRATCDCPKGSACRDAAKHPRTEHGLSDATLDEDKIRRWWSMWPRANIGIAVPPGYVVLDIDGADGLDAIAAEGWRIPETATAATARGWHHWFLADVEIRPGSHFLDSVDMRGPGSYVVAPPSLHASGVQYAWEDRKSPVECAMAPAPAWLYELVRRARERRRREPLPSGDAPIPEGERNPTLTRLAGVMRRAAFSERAIAAALLTTNAERCSPPLEEEDVQKIAWSVARYEPAERCPWCCASRASKTRAMS
jgi:putative DNA primase/helicase